MGLKYFHYLFIALSILCTLAFGCWALFTNEESMGAWGRAGGAFSTLVGLVLGAYGVWFVKKSRRVLR